MPSISVVVLATGGRRESIAGAVAAVLAVRPADVTARLVSLPAIAAFDLDHGAASSVVRAIEQAGGRAVAV
ncbi:MAG: hypothetical protein FJX36_15895 [Alphaproteobacteria bacterium]|nr:hypothetical protein [Alphaproteobacteria bacterium]